MKHLILVVLIALATLAHARPAAAQADGDAVARGEPIVVGTKIAPPFVMEGENGLEGLSIDLWRRLADELDLETRFEVVTLEAMLAGVAEERFGAGISAISITPDREARMDLTHGYFTSGLGIAVPTGGGGMGWARTLSNIFTPAFLSAIGALALLLLVVGIVVWFVEHRRNTEQFEPGAVKGIGSGFWFAAVTMTTVGYGDKAPLTLPGRIVALIWMFGSIIVISAFTGAIASSLTTAQISSAVRGPEDLRDVRVGALTDSATLPALRDRGTTARPFPTIDEGLAALADGTIDAFVHDWPILKYEISRNRPGEITMLEAQFDVNAYAIALPSGSPLREPLNQRILALTRDRSWSDVVDRYLGSGRP